MHVYMLWSCLMPYEVLTLDFSRVCRLSNLRFLLFLGIPPQLFAPTFLRYLLFAHSSLSSCIASVYYLFPLCIFDLS